jgi:hypothetical protein
MRDLKLGDGDNEELLFVCENREEVSWELITTTYFSLLELHVLFKTVTCRSITL